MKGNYSAGGDTESFPEKRSQVSIHGSGSFEGSGCFLAKTNLNVLTAVFYSFTLKRDEPKICSRWYAICNRLDGVGGWQVYLFAFVLGEINVADKRQRSPLQALS
ncbi:hypothetical protein IG612_11835 [Pectobacterium sp. FL60-S17]|uniref:Uncharacterized protein n=1 Tax=Pectobacterium quasiaquaticum TaxID=2774015 RepID=A0A9Q2ES69_9GAMM|nr:hypothetical protein [Pectobacterium quasiaquaticum]MBE5203289.1 hypothetical protein [Pectobacterium quasiaquaticum]MBE5208773.1 hypothetical protein [Pectobacterium quasiaquaticum]MBE5221183.1 hypothetical protein [Pectobacterium quasiaquaticum]URG51093.1 hypothetical protein IG609_002295 [Pectobacterium quasiaquaticum]